jgi:anti-sigma B factor antagonist
MPQSNTTITVRKPTATASIIDIKGEINGAAESKLTDAYTQATDGNVRLIVLNFKGVDYMNSSGIGLLVTLLIRANRQKQQLVAVGLTEHYRNIFELTRLNEAIRMYATEAEALAEAGM